jgi:hypothetical protein
MNKINLDKFDEILRSGADYDYDSSSCKGQCDDYCRCSEIINTCVTKVRISEIVSEIVRNAKITDPILSYCIDRIVQLGGLTDTSQWAVLISGGYYGEETHGVKLNEDIKNHIASDLLFLNSCSDRQRIEFVLTKEYGFVLPSVAECKTWEVKTIKKIDLILPNQDRLFYVRKMDSNLIASYREYPYARGVAIKDGAKYRLVDGYHRTSAESGDDITLVLGSP